MPGAAVVAVMLPCRYAVATAVAVAKADADAVAVAPDSGYAGKKRKDPRDCLQPQYRILCLS